MTAVLATWLSLSLALAPITASTTPPVTPSSEPVTAPPDDGPAKAESRAHFRDGLAAYERNDFAGAIMHWEQARDAMGGVPELDDARHVLELDLGRAHLRAYDRGGERHHLEAARALIEAYLQWIDREGHELSAAEREDRPRALTMLARIDIASEDSFTVPSPPSPRVDPQPDPEPVVQRDLSPRLARRFVIAGSTALGLAAAGLVGTVAGFRIATVTRNEYDRTAADLPVDQAKLDALVPRNRRALALGVGSLMVMLVGTAVGIPLVVKGARGRRNARLRPLAGGFAF
ncbi:MAG TPA: hypothetical protein VG755_17725 [Nannocystaceae bacterium]|nr:hypothetical protein [Nannocystaceae bacterium]